MTKCSAETMSLPLDVNVPASAPAMRDLLPLLATHNLSIRDRQNDVVRGAAEMLADGDAILGDCCDFHLSFSPHTACRGFARS